MRGARARRLPGLVPGLCGVRHRPRVHACSHGGREPLMNYAQPRRLVGIVQPTYLPWLPFFERMAAADVFVLLDDVEYSKNSFFNRNAIKTARGRQLLTVPVLYSGNSRAKIADIRVSEAAKWRTKHLRTIEQAYSKASYWSAFRDEIAEIYSRQCDRLIDIVLPSIALIRRAFGVDTDIHLSSKLGIAGERNEKLVRICKHFGASHFIVKPGTEHYHPLGEFEPHGIRFAYLSYSNLIYPQLHGVFEPMLSALDYLLNCGPGQPPFVARCRLAEVEPA